MMKTQLYRFTLPTVREIRLGKERLSDRSGFLLAYRDEFGNAGFGEAAPLPGFSTETLDDARKALHAFCSTGEGKGDQVPASVRFAIDQAASELLAIQSDHLLHRVLDTYAPDGLAINALILTDEPLDRQIERIRKNGYRAVKLKVGGNPDDDLKRVQYVAAELGPDVKIRLDANRAWTYEEATRFVQNLDVPIDYIEEPLQDSEELGRFVDETSAPIALDESLVDWSQDRIADAGFATAFILKPMLIGGMEDVRAMVELAERAGARVVFSGAFETSVGRRFSMALAAAFAGSEVHGFDTARFLKSDLVTDSAGRSSAVADLRTLFAEDLQLKKSAVERLR
jgi:o-succinylbenzoate synthase